MTRDEKITAAVDGMAKQWKKQFPTWDADRQILRTMAEAAVNALDPPKHVDLTGGFYATPIDVQGEMWSIFDSGPQYCAGHGSLTREAMEDWARAAKLLRPLGH